MSNINLEFVMEMENQLIENSHKGQWDLWNPEAEEVISELKHHFDKLVFAIETRSIVKTKEHSADLANICSKAFEVSLHFDTEESK